MVPELTDHLSCAHPHPQSYEEPSLAVWSVSGLGLAWSLPCGIKTKCTFPCLPALCSCTFHEWQAHCKGQHPSQGHSPGPSRRREISCFASTQKGRKERPKCAPKARRSKTVTPSLLSGHQFKFSSGTKSSLTHCNLVDYSTPGFPFLHHHPEITQTHAH